MLLGVDFEEGGEQDSRVKNRKIEVLATGGGC